MLIDPRPYTYQYRKPRIFNPTYQSRNLYESLYHRYPQEGNDYFSPKVPVRYESNDRIQRYGNQQEHKDMGRNMSDLKGRRGNTNDVQSGANTDRNPERAPAGYRLPSIGKSYDHNRAQSNLGANMQQPQNNQQNPIQRRKGFERFRIYQRQQKPFNIISCYPKEDDSNKLRSFPKLTLEDKLIQRGSYHNFREQKF